MLGVEAGRGYEQAARARGGECALDANQRAGGLLYGDLVLAIFAVLWFCNHVGAVACLNHTGANFQYELLYSFPNL